MDESEPWRRGCRTVLFFLVNITWSLLLCVRNILKNRQLHRTQKHLTNPTNHGGIAAGKTVLVTTGRQAKTLHIIRALKEVGATVIVTDYHHISASALSLACDRFIVLPPLEASAIQSWIHNFKQILEENNVDVVLPASTINEVLFVGLAQQQLAADLPHINWICPDLEIALKLDDRSQFSSCCDTYNVPTPDHGKFTSAANIHSTAQRFSKGIIAKRIESSVNRQEEIICINHGDSIPAYFTPTLEDPWQWQRFISGTEYSVWYVCIDGEVTFSGCYHSEPDLVHFDPTLIDEAVDKALRGLMKGLRLNGQFAFDYIKDDTSGHSYVIECNPRASSILETVSRTPLWGEAFFGIDVSKRTVYNSIGFIYHGNCWPWSNRSEGYFARRDPLPLLGAELVWPLNAIAAKGLSKTTYQKIDVNICKIIVDGPSAGRDLKSFCDHLNMQKISIAIEALKYMDTLLLDVTVPKLKLIIESCRSMNVKVILLRVGSCSVPQGVGQLDDIICIPDGNISDELINAHTEGETRILLGSEQSQRTSGSSDISYRIVCGGKTWLPKYEIPLRKLRVLHVMGSCASPFYEMLSSTYGYLCIDNVGGDSRFEHFVAYIHPSGQWCVEPYVKGRVIEEKGKRISAGEGIAKVERLGIDVIIPHMFDYEGLTAFRSVFNILKIPLVGCTADALALSTNKARTNACAHVAGIQVPQFKVVRRGEEPSRRPPFVVKPSEEDNSQGITVVKKEEDIEKALNDAFEFCDEVICEDFIAPGRELRVGLVETGDGQLEMLPIIEYFISEQDPVRTKEHKLGITADVSALKLVGSAPGGTCLPADIDDQLREKLYSMLSKAHKALGCRDYSIFDIRVDKSGEPFMLETCLYCSFAESSVLVKMQSSVGISKKQLFQRLCERALTRRFIGNGSDNGTGMRVKN